MWGCSKNIPTSDAHLRGRSRSVLIARLCEITTYSVALQWPAHQEIDCFFSTSVGPFADTTMVEGNRRTGAHPETAQPRREYVRQGGWRTRALLFIPLSEHLLRRKIYLA